MAELTNLYGVIAGLLDLPFGEILIRSTLCVALAALVCKVIRGQSAALRHRIWVIGLSVALLVPAGRFLLPQRMLPFLPPEVRAITSVPDGRPTISSNEPGDSARAAAGIDATTAPVPAVGDTLIPTTNNNQQPAAALAGGITRPRIEQAFIVVWLLGTTVGALQFVVLLVMQRARLRRLKRVSDAEWTAAVAAASQAIGLKRTIVTLESNVACIPAAFGVVSSRLVIPSNWRDWSARQRHCVLLHELAHIQRSDVAAQLLGRIALIVYWFNPLAWYAVRQLRAERELAADDCVLRTGQKASDYAEQLLSMLRNYSPARLEIGVAMANSARLDQRVLAILDPQRRRDAVNARFTFALSCAAMAVTCMLGSLTLTRQAVSADPALPAVAQTKNADPVWQQKYAVQFEHSLPVSVAFSRDGQSLLTGDTSGEVMALIAMQEPPTYRWKTQVSGSHAAIAFSADERYVYATMKHGVRILDAKTGQDLDRIEVGDSNPVAVGVFPDREVSGGVTRRQIAFGNQRGYFIESWIEGKLVDSIGAIETSTVADDAQPVDEASVPLAVDPKGRSAIMTGPVDVTGQMGGEQGKNVVWAYACGNYDEGSPGNRVLTGHTATVVSAAWSRDGGTAVTGDADGRVIIWNATTMKESRRLQFGGRIGALAMSDDGKRTAAYVLGKQGDVYVWDTATLAEEMKPIHTELTDFTGKQAYASLAFAPAGNRLAGSAIRKDWLTQLKQPVGTVRVWELTAAPSAQVAPKPTYEKELSPGHSAQFVLWNNESLLTAASKEGAVDLRRVRDGEIQARIVLGKLTIGNVKISTDRLWVAIEQRPVVDESGKGPTERTFDIGVYEAPILPKGSIPACSRLLDISSSRGTVAVVRNGQIQLWDAETTRELKASPFEFSRITCATFSPAGQLLAIADGSGLLLWDCEKNTYERIELSEPVGSLAFSPDGKFLAEGPSPGKSIHIRSLESRKVVRTLVLEDERTMNIPRLTFVQGGRVLIACDDLVLNERVPTTQRIYVWDTAAGTLAHRIEVSAGLPKYFDVSPNGRYLVAAIEQSDRIKLRGWRLDGQELAKDVDTAPPDSPSR